MIDQSFSPEDPSVIFEQADKLAGANRDAYLDRACGGNPELRATIESMLVAHAKQGDFLAEPTASFDDRVGAGPGTVIGPYKLREVIGTGGMGVVFVAEQEQPVRRKVALKIIKPGMDSAEVVARFEAERQALALMDHPNIAKVLDAGSTESDRPYFVMELVRGIPITEYCDKKKLSVQERLELFVTVCQAVQHAHQKGIIHRDIKPSNVLVADHDGKPVPMVIDFGVAKATNQRLTERTIYTRFAQIVGTPMYMSPEQAEFSGLDVDTRSDIYSLGVLLYELLTGKTPFEKQRLQEAAYDEILRIIREEEPVKPSVRISTLGENATLVSNQRKTDLKRLIQSVRGDLDWIVLTAMEKDRTRRYDTAAGLASDVQRYLQHDAIAARPPSLVYQSFKFARRHRTAAITSFLVLASLVLGIISTTWMGIVARQEARRANETLESLVETLYDKAVLDVLMNNQEMGQETLEILRDKETMPTKALVLEGLMALNRGDYDRAVRCAKDARKLDSNNVSASALLTTACIWAGYDDVGELQLPRLRSMEPNSVADRLLKAYAMLSTNPQGAVDQLDSESAVKHSPVGLLVRAYADLGTAVCSGQSDAVAIEKTVRDFEYVQFLFRNTPAARSHRLLAIAAAIRLARSEGRTDAAERYIEEGRELAAQLMLDADDYPAGAWSCQHYYLAAGQSDQAWRAICKVGRYPSTYSWFLAAACMEKYGTDAIDEFDKIIDPKHRKNKYIRLARALLLGCCPNRHGDIKLLVEDLLDSRSALLRTHALLAMWPVWSADKIREQTKSNPIHAYWFKGKWEDYLNGQIDESELLEQADETTVAQLHARFTMAWMSLADGRREEARRHFEACVALDGHWFFDYAWARGFLALMNADSSWPHSPSSRVDEALSSQHKG
ncbi:MAG: protein kinase [Pirellulales bacterium]|nr:protein kinase [Pirellulales bacterium]